MSGRRRTIAAVTGVVAVLALALVFVQVREHDEPTAASPDSAEGPMANVDEHNTAAAAGMSAPGFAAEDVDPVDSHTQRVLALVRRIEQALSATDAAVREEAVDTLLAELAGIDPPSAGALAESWEAGPMRDELLRRVAQLWGAADPAGAIEWVAQLADPEARQQAAAALGHQLATTDPADAVRVAQLLGLPAEGEAFASLVRAWAEHDLLSALGWTLRQPPGPSRDQLLAGVAVVQARLQPAQAAQLVQTQMTEGPVREQAMLDVMQQWAAQDPAGAERAVSRVTDDALRDRVRDELERMNGDPEPVPAE